jgi:DNA-binding beta-propeller fold protein YncE
MRPIGLLAIGLSMGILGVLHRSRAQQETGARDILLPSSKVLRLPVPGHPQRINSFPTAMAVSPDGRYVAILNNGYGTKESGYDESIALLDLSTHQVTDFPDPRLAKRAHQTYFLGLAFGADGKHLYASLASLTDPEGKTAGDTGNAIAVYSVAGGHLTPERLITIPLQVLGAHHPPTKVSRGIEAGKAVPYPAGLAVIDVGSAERLLVADNLSDDALLLDAATGRVIHRFDLSTHAEVPASYPYGVVATRDGQRAYCSLWNASAVAELDLHSGRVVRTIPLLAPKSPTAPGSHPTAMLLSPDEKRLYVTLSNADRVAVIDTAAGALAALLSSEPPGQRYGGSFPNALAESADGSRLFVADASTNAVGVFDTTQFREGGDFSPLVAAPTLGFFPTEWYPTALAVHGGDLLIASAKGEGTGPNDEVMPPGPLGESRATIRGNHPYIASLIHGSVAVVSISEIESHLAGLTREVELNNRMLTPPHPLQFAGGANPIRHVIYVIKENRSYDQVFGDLKEANGDPALCMYCEDITPNQHALARQFGILDNFYVSGEVSGNGHVWSTAAITSDYTEKTWEIGYRGDERTYDYEGDVGNAIPLREGIPDVNEPDTGYLWGDVARAGLTHRNYGEYVTTEWCPEFRPGALPPPGGTPCPKAFIQTGEPLPANVGQPHGAPSPWPWPVPIIAEDIATKPELEGHFDPRYADFRLDYPDQLRVDEFLNEFEEFVKARSTGRGVELPQFVILRLPNDHTMGTRPGGPRPAASVADNDLAVGRVVEAVSHSPYWDDTAIFILEDDAQDGPDHVDAHRSPALVISKYSPGSKGRPFVDHHFYTTVNMIRTMEMLLGLPPMNANDAWAEPMAALFTGTGNQPPFSADYRNRDNRLIYETNPPRAPGAQESLQMDFTHADAADAAKLNRILWRDRKGDAPLPLPRHAVIRGGEGDE